jgi:hypothetical protein
MATKEEKCVNEKVSQLFEFRAELENLDAAKQELKDRVITPEIKAQIQAYTDALITPDMLQQLKDIDMEFEGKSAIAKVNSKLLEDAVRAETLVAKKSQWSADLKHACQFVNGKDKVDVAGLKGFGKIVPAVLDFVTTEDPTTRIV